MFCRVRYLTSLFSSDQAGTGVEYTHRALAATFIFFKILQVCSCVCMNSFFGVYIHKLQEKCVFSFDSAIWFNPNIQFLGKYKIC